MIQQFLRMFFRNTRKSFFSSLTNIFSIALGFTAFIIVALWVNQELSFDNYNENKDRIYRVSSRGKLFDKEIKDALSGAVFSKTIPDVFAEVENVATMFNFHKAMMTKTNGEALRLNAAGANSALFDVFSLPVLQGNYKSLDQPNTAFLTESAAKKLFGNENPVGQVISTGMDRENKKFTIAGIIKDIPENSHFQFDFLFSLQSLSFYRNPENDWINTSFYNYLLLHEGTNHKTFEAKLNKYAKGHFAPILKNWRNLSLDEWESKGESWGYTLQPLSKIHLYSSLKNEFMANGDITYVLMAVAVGLLILIISMVNFINLTTVSSMSRAKEISVKKISGATQKSIMVHFIAESCAYSFVALLLSSIFVYLLIPVFGTATGIHIFINLQSHLKLWIWSVPFSLLLGFLAGIYPAFIVSKRLPLQVLTSKANFKVGNKVFFKDLLLTAQFTIGILVIIGTISVTRQLNFLQNEKLGFEKENVLIVRQTVEMSRSQQAVFKERLLSNSMITTASFSHRIPGMELGSRSYQLHSNGELKTCLFDVCPCEADFFSTYNFELSEGNFFTDNLTEKPRSIVINEKAAKEYNIEDPVGKRLYFGKDNYYEITGVVKDFHYDSKRTEIQPAAFVQEPDVRFFWSPEYLSLNISAADKPKLLREIKGIYNEILPGKEFVYSFFDSDYDALYKKEYQTKYLFLIFSIVAVCLSCIGLFSMVKNMVQSRVKEIGVRKVNGAHSNDILKMISGGYLKWVAIAFVIACPIAYYAMNKWLEKFAYKTTLSWWIFALAGLLALGIALLTVSWQSWRAATRNPVEALRYE